MTIYIAININGEGKMSAGVQLICGSDLIQQTTNHGILKNLS
jgi:hypothetical protein